MAGIKATTLIKFFPFGCFVAFVAQTFSLGSSSCKEFVGCGGLLSFFVLDCGCTTSSWFLAVMVQRLGVFGFLVIPPRPQSPRIKT